MAKYLNNRLLVSITILSLAMVARDFFGVDIHQLVFLMVIGVTGLLLNYNELFCYTAFFSSIACGVNGFAVTVLLLLLVIKSNHRSLSHFLPAIILIIIEVLHSSIYQFPISSELLYFSNILLFFYCCCDANSISPQLVVRYFVFGAALCCILIVGRTYISTGSLISIFLDSARTGVTMGGEELVSLGETHMALNANSLAFISIIGFSSLLIGPDTLGVSRFVFSVLLFVLLFGGIVTMGRTWILVLAGVTVLYVFTTGMKRKLMFTFGILAVLVIIFQISALHSLLSVITDGFTDRFNSSDFSEAGGRTEIWRQYMEIWKSKFEYIVLGISAPNYRLLFPQINAIHNITQQAFVCTGLVGFIVYISFFVGVIRKALKQHTRFICFIPLIAALAYLQSISVLANWILILPVFPCVYALKIKKEI